MIIVDSDNQPVMLDSIIGPNLTEYMWTLDLSIMDFTLAPLVMIEELICPAIQILIQGFEFILPANWNILVYDSETSQLDIIQVCDTGGREFTAFVYGPNASFPTPGIITATNYHPVYTHVGPSVNKHQMIAAAIGPEQFILVSPFDGFNKYLKSAAIGDLTGF